MTRTLISIAIIVMLMLALGIILFVILYQRRVIRHQHEIKEINERKQIELIQASIQGEEEERMRIAAELHDDVGATLSSIRLFLHSAAKKEKNASIINQSKDLLDDSIQKIRNISHKLQPALLQQLGLQASLESFIAMINKPAVVQMFFTCPQPLPRLEDNVELSVYRIIQELTTNILRHSGAEVITLDMMVVKEQLEIQMLHNGNGLTDELFQQLIYKKGSIGLKNIVNRLKSIDAVIHFSQPGDHLFKTTIHLPIKINNKP